jgi:hypothetical protein
VRETATVTTTMRSKRSIAAISFAMGRTLRHWNTYPCGQYEIIEFIWIGA